MVIYLDFLLILSEYLINPKKKKRYKDIHGPQRINPTDFADPTII